jgi:hypothetical protein
MSIADWLTSDTQVGALTRINTSFTRERIIKSEARISIAIGAVPFPTPLLRVVSEMILNEARRSTLLKLPMNRLASRFYNPGQRNDPKNLVRSPLRAVVL